MNLVIADVVRKRLVVSLVLHLPFSLSCFISQAFFSSPVFAVSFSKHVMIFLRLFPFSLLSYFSLSPFFFYFQNFSTISLLSFICFALSQSCLLLLFLSLRLFHSLFFLSRFLFLFYIFSLFSLSF